MKREKTNINRFSLGKFENSKLDMEQIRLRNAYQFIVNHVYIYINIVLLDNSLNHTYKVVPKVELLANYPKSRHFQKILIDSILLIIDLLRQMPSRSIYY